MCHRASTAQILSIWELLKVRLLYPYPVRRDGTRRQAWHDGMIRQLANLKVLYLHSNQLITGSIPSEIGQLVNLNLLELYSNQLTGSIPPEIGQLANLKGLYLLGNQLNGSIPPEIGQLANLEELHLYSNQLTGSIPVSYTHLTLPTNREV